MAYTVKELFLTLQGEGAHAGRAAVLCRFAGCNLWSGREKDRAVRTAASATRTSWVPTEMGAVNFARPRTWHAPLSRPGDTTCYPARPEGLLSTLPRAALRPA